MLMSLISWCECSSEGERWKLQGAVFQGNISTQFSLLPPETGEPGESDLSHGLMNIDHQLVLVQNNCSALFFLCLCCTGIRSFIGTEKWSLSTLTHQSVSPCWHIYLSVYLHGSMYAKESVAEGRDWGMCGGWMRIYIIPSYQARGCAVRQGCYPVVTIRKKKALSWRCATPNHQKCLFQTQTEPQWTYAALQGEARTLLGGDLLGQDRGNYGAKR